MPTNRPWPPLAKPPQLGTDDVHVWAVPLNVSRDAYEDLLATLASDERQRASEFHVEDPRRRYVIARGTLRRLLGEYLHAVTASVELTIDQNQKPHLASTHATSNLHFNVSHSGDLAVIGFARGCEVGADVEQLRDIGQLEQIARRYFHPTETAAVLAVPESARNYAFLRCWTGKEAILKALGTGIVENLAGFQVPIDDGWKGWVEYSASAPTEQRPRCWLERLNPQDGYVAAIAYVESKRAVHNYTFAI